MTSGDGGHANASEVDPVSGAHLADLATVARSARPQTSRHDDHGGAGDGPEGSIVEMVGVSVRDEDTIDRANLGRIRRRPKSP